jgi:hypothetical protein
MLLSHREDFEKNSPKNYLSQNLFVLVFVNQETEQADL